MSALPTRENIRALAKALGLPTFENPVPATPLPPIPTGFWVVDSVDAAKGGDFKRHAVGGCQGVIAAVMTAEYASAQDAKDYLVLDDRGRVVA